MIVAPGAPEQCGQRGVQPRDAAVAVAEKVERRGATDRGAGAAPNYASRAASSSRHATALSACRCSSASACRTFCCACSTCVSHVCASRRWRRMNCSPGRAAGLRGAPRSRGHPAAEPL
jgi:hypothetical protein